MPLIEKQIECEEVEKVEKKEKKKKKILAGPSQKST